MGRPIRKDKMQPIGDTGPTGTSGRIAVSNYRTGGSNTASTTAYIVSQRGSLQFKIHLEDSSEEVMTLVGKATLDTNGTFNVRAILDDSSVVYVTKFFNRTFHWLSADGNSTGHAFYSLGAENTDEGGGSGEAASINSGSIDVI